MSELIRLERKLNEFFKTIDLRIIENPVLSWRAKGLHTYLISRPPGWKIWYKDLVQRATDGTTAVRSAVKELQDTGYLKIERQLDESKKVIGSRWIVAQTPALLQSELEPHSDSPDTVFPDVGFPNTGNQSRSKDQSVVSNNGNKEHDLAAHQIIARLNELRESSWEWARYTPLAASPTNVEQINGRLKEYAEADLVLVLEYLAVKDGGDEKSRGYFDCVTPFRVKNFERRLVMAREWEARGRPSKNGDNGVRGAPLLPQGHDPAIYEKRVKGGVDNA